MMYLKCVFCFIVVVLESCQCIPQNDDIRELLNILRSLQSENKITRAEVSSFGEIQKSQTADTQFYLAEIDVDAARKLINADQSNNAAVPKLKDELNNHDKEQLGNIVNYDTSSENDREERPPSYDPWRYHRPPPPPSRHGDWDHRPPPPPRHRDWDHPPPPPPRHDDWDHPPPPPRHGDWDHPPPPPRRRGGWGHRPRDRERRDGDRLSRGWNSRPPPPPHHYYDHRPPPHGPPYGGFHGPPPYGRPPPHHGPPPPYGRPPPPHGRPPQHYGRPPGGRPRGDSNTNSGSSAPIIINNYNYDQSEVKPDHDKQITMEPIENITENGGRNLNDKYVEIFGQPTMNKNEYPVLDGRIIENNKANYALSNSPEYNGPIIVNKGPTIPSFQYQVMPIIPED